MDGVDSLGSTSIAVMQPLLFSRLYEDESAEI
jgi:hypothetical protein